MRRQHFFAVLSGLAAIALVAADASAMYHPTLGRFLQRDPAGYTNGLHLAQYARNSPLVYKDPMGLSSIMEGLEAYWETRKPTPDDYRPVFSAGVDLTLGTAYKRRREGWTYGADAMEKWREGKAGTYRGNAKMRADLAQSAAIRNTLEDLVEPAVLAAGIDLPCWGVDELAMSVEFGEEAGRPIELDGELEAAARAPDEITCQVGVVLAKACDPKAKCCPSIPYVAVASCDLVDRYDFHNPIDPKTGDWIPEYRDKSPEKKRGLLAAWQLQEQSGIPAMAVKVAFEVELKDELCAP